MKNRRLILMFAVLCAMPVLAQKSGDLIEKTKDSPTLRAAFKDVVARAYHSVVQVRCDNRDVALGTVVSPDGLILTKASELKGNMVVKTADGTSLPAKLVGVSFEYDIAALKVDGKDFAAADFSSAQPIRVGEWVATPGLKEEPIGVGVISVGRRKIAGVSGMMGVLLGDTETGMQGVGVNEVSPGSAAEKAGVKSKDRILSVNGEEFATREKLVERLRKTKPGDTVQVKILRGAVAPATQPSTQPSAAAPSTQPAGAKLAAAPTTQPSTQPALAVEPPKTLDLTVTLMEREDRSARAKLQNSMGGPESKRRIDFPVTIQHDTVLMPQSCGGPLVDLQGNMVGLNIARSGRVETFALPADVVKTLIGEFLQGKYPASLTPPPGPVVPKPDPTTKPSTQPTRKLS